MLVWLRDLLYDPRSFANFIRVAVFVLGDVFVEAVPSSRAWYAGKLAQALALAVRAGDKNTPPPPHGA